MVGKRKKAANEMKWIGPPVCVPEGFRVRWAGSGSGPRSAKVCVTGAAGRRQEKTNRNDQFSFRFQIWCCGRAGS
jgi:hypothetical protein